MDLATIAIPQPTLTFPLPNDQQALMTLFYDHWQALSAQVREHNQTVSAKAKADGVEIEFGLIGVDTTVYDFLREPRQAEIAAVFPPKVNAAVILGNHNYQVGNGGWLQYHDNGYSASVEALRALYQGAADVGIADADKVLALIDQFMQRLKDDQAPRAPLRYFDEDGDGEMEDDSFDNFDDLNSPFYAIDTEALMQAMMDRFDEVVAGSFMAGAYKKAA